MSLSGGCVIAGIGQTPFTRGTEKSTVGLHLDAALEAIADAGLKPSDIDGVMPNELAGTIAEDFIVNLGLENVTFSSTMRHGGASLLSAVKSACLAVHTGVAKHVLLVAGRRGFSQQRMSKASEGTIPPHPLFREFNEFESPFGNTAPLQWFAPAAMRHMHEFGTTSEQLGRIALTCREHANLNPRALMHDKKMTMEDYLASPMIADPYRKFDCSLETDGATAFVITSAERGRDLKKAGVPILGLGEGHGTPPTSMTHKRDMTKVEGIEQAGKQAFEMAGLKPRDISSVQLYDAFTWVVLSTLEDLGFCQKGEGGAFVESGVLGLSGGLPLNTSGGLLSEGHCSGANLLSEAVRQLRGEVEQQRQISNCNNILISGEGHFHEGAVAILGRPV